MLKRTFDVAAAATGLLLLSPLFLLIAVLIKLDSRGTVFFRQERIGRGFRPFEILKFRTMVSEAPALGGELTVGNDRRITRVGRVLRSTKVDELPPLLNVLRGDMSIVGPRPEVRRYVDRFRQDYEPILRVRPGITDPASIRFRDEAALLARAADPEDAYLRTVLPQKLRLANDYVRRSSVLLDLALIARTVGALFRRGVPS
jgi:lipopolysaccharide/colanic/teichoic acid biosynthesis glycosyltransferase